MKQKGFSLLELLVSFSISIFIFYLFSTFINFSIKNLSLIKKNEEKNSSLFLSLEKIKLDVSKAGMNLRYSDGSLSVEKKSLKIKFAEYSTFPSREILSGQNIIYVEDSSFFKENREILIYDFLNREINKIKSKGKNFLILYDNLKNTYLKSTAEIFLIETIDYKFYQDQKVLKYSENGGYFQPLIENIEEAIFEFNEDFKLLSVKITINPSESLKFTYFAKNLFLSKERY
ncbi:MAG: prepilin-type N-terminal cleavage/methylation domain-containing protein [Acidobacteriota bacterium]